MSLAITMLKPAIWAQEGLFQLAEEERDRKIGKDPIREDTKSYLKLRVAAVALGVIQLAYSLLLAIPVTLAAAGRAISLPDSTRLGNNPDSLPERVAITTLAAWACLLAPIVSSAITAISPETLDTSQNPATFLPAFSYSALLAYTLSKQHIPTLSGKTWRMELVKALTRDILENSAMNYSPMVDTSSDGFKNAKSSAAGASVGTSLSQILKESPDTNSNAFESLSSFVEGFFQHIIYAKKISTPKYPNSSNKY